MIKGIKKAKIKNYKKQNEEKILFVLKIVSKIIDNCLLEIFEYVYLVEEKYTFVDIADKLYLSESTFKRKIKLLNTLIKAIEEEI